MNYRFSSYGQAATRPSPVNQMMAAFAADFRDDVDINLGVGYVNEKTIPDALLVEAMAHVSAAPDEYRQAFNYGGPQGSPNLIRALHRFYLEQRIGDMSEAVLARNDTVIGPSGATSLLEALADIFAPGIVVTADPMYYIYCHHLERKGFRVLTVPEDANGLSPEAVEARLESLGANAHNLAFFYVVTVNNPSCAILSNEYRHGLVDLATRWSQRLDRAVPIFFDQAYEWLIHDPEIARPCSALHWDTAGIVHEIGTLSKVLAPALRIGFMIGPPGPLMQAVVQKTSDVGFSAPLMNQEMAAYMLEHHIAGQIRSVNEGYRAKARAVGDCIDAVLGPWIETRRGGSGGFYYYLDLKGIDTGTDTPFFHFLARNTGNPVIDGPADTLHPRVIYLPGEFCVHPEGASAALGKRQLRLSYGFEDTETICAALMIIRDAIEYAESAKGGAGFS